MPLNNYTMGEGYIPAYQISAVPYITSSILVAGEIQQISFPFVTRFFSVQNISPGGSDQIAVAVTLNGLNPVVGNYFSLNQGAQYQDELRTTVLFVSNSVGDNVRFQVVAGLTGIPASNFLQLTASNGYQGVG